MSLPQQAQPSRWRVRHSRPEGQGIAIRCESSGSRSLRQRSQSGFRRWRPRQLVAPLIRESFTGAWQRNIEVRAETLLTFHAVYACVTRIAQDIGKLRIKLVEQDSDGIWTEVSSPAFSPVLRKPNSYQNRIKFVEHVDHQQAAARQHLCAERARQSRRCGRALRA
jgi:hypothetical protein